MAWLKSVLRRSEARTEEVAVLDRGPIPPLGPLLAVLVPDTGGVSSFRLRGFHDAPLAAEYIGGLMPQLRQNVYSFWGLHNAPVSAEDMKVEATVLIRASEGSDLVYIVSFLDIESAYSFTRFEVKRGLQLQNVMIYWASFAEVVEDANGFSVVPPLPPVTAPVAPWPEARAQVATVELPTAQPEPVVERAHAPFPEPPARDAEETEALEAVEQYLHRAQAAELAEAEAAHPVIEIEPKSEEEIDAPVWPEATVAPVSEPEPASEWEPVASADEVDDEGPMWPEAPGARVAEPAAEVAPPAAEPEDDLYTEDPAEQEALKQAYVFHHKVPALAQEGMDAGMIEVEPEPLLPAGAVIAFAGDEEIDGRTGPATADVETDVQLDRGYAESDVAAYPGDEETDVEKWGEPDPELPSTFKRYDEFDVAYEVERLLKNRGFDKRDGPFSGFKSPPGRF